MESVTTGDNFREMLRLDDKLSHLEDYMDYHLSMMSPSRYNFKFTSTDDRKLIYEKMMNHKYLHGECIKILISKELERSEVIEISKNMIEYLIDEERYEEIPYFQNIIIYYESSI